MRVGRRLNPKLLIRSVAAGLNAEGQSQHFTTERMER